MPKSKPIVAIIFNRISKDNAIEYGKYLQWIQNALSKRFR
jgi:hypothetical protein